MEEVPVQQPIIQEPLNTPPAKTWKEQLTAYRLVIIIFAVLLVGATAAVVLNQTKYSPSPPPVPTPAAQQTGDGTPKSLTLKAADDPELMEIELQDIDIDRYLDQELRALEQDIKQL